MAMRIKAFIIALLVASPAFSQTRVYTNADLGQPRSWTSALTPSEAAAILAPHQYVYVAPLPPGPQVVVIDSSPTAGPFGEFKPFSPSRRLDGSLWTDSPWVTTTYIGRQRYSLRDSNVPMRGYALPPLGHLNSRPIQAIGRLQPERAKAATTASGAAKPGRGHRPRD